MSRIPFLIFHLLAAVAAIALGISLYPSAHYLGGLHLPLSEHDINEKALSVLSDIGIDTGEFRVQTRVRYDQNFALYLQKRFGVAESNRLMREELPVFSWNFRLTSPDAEERQAASTDRDDSGEHMWSTPADAIMLRLDGFGRMLRYAYSVPDTASLPSLDIDTARNIAETFIQAYGRYSPSELSGLRIQTIERGTRVDYEFTWTREDIHSERSISVKVTVAGNIVSEYEMSYNLPTDTTIERDLILSSFTAIFIYLIIAVMMVYLGIKKIRSGEIGFKYAIVAGIVITLAYGIQFFVLQNMELEWYFLIPLLFVSLVIGGLTTIGWAVSESVVRETWREKLVSLDLLGTGHLLHSKIGTGIMRGISGGAVIFLVWMLLQSAGVRLFPVWYNYQSEILNFLNSFSPSFFLLLQSAYLGIFFLAFFAMFFTSFLYQRTGNGFAAIIGGAILYGAAHGNMIQPLPYGITVSILYGIILLLIFLRYDVLTAFVAIFVMSLAEWGTALVIAGNDTMLHHGITIVLFVLALVGLAAFSLFTRDRVREFSSLAPTYQRLISERERLQREIEIAREVQMSFLPKSDPVIPQFDIASICIPANEVGGDYYDFIHLPGDRFGVVVGDVSGKGTKASFYMTLTKGILRSTVRNSDSPAEILKQVNSLFYENAERGAFISMVYGCFDLRTRTLKVSRAGHNPVIIWDSTSDNSAHLHPNGMALGLDDGSLFDKTIQEKKISYSAGDLLVFYTDGFTEAENASHEEFGNDRLFETVNRNRHKSAREIIDSVAADIHSFCGKVKQRDDMTMVAVKITDTL
jgi:phosphoserine phosphatase RsbU/P